MKPLLFRQGSVTVKVYGVTRPKTTRQEARTVFTVAWHAAGRRLTKQFADIKQATEEAKLKAEQLAAGRMESAASMSADDLALLQEVRRLAGDTPVVTALEQWQRARELAGADVIAACEHWARRNGNLTEPLTVTEAVDKFLAAKRASGVKVKANYERTLPGFCDAVGQQPIALVSPEAIQSWLAKFKHPVTQNSHRRRIVTLFRWCRKKGMLPLDVMTTAERTDSAQEGNEVIGLVTPEQLRSAFKHVRKKASELVPALTLLSMCGMRRAETDRQDWQHIDLERKILRVSHAKPNTPAHRLIALPECAIEWLMKYRAKSGPVSPKNATDRIRRICREAKLTLAENGFRHMWISARVTLTGDINGTSLEAGNTPQVLIKHYRELVSLKEAQAWFEIRPRNTKPRGGVFQMPQAASAQSQSSGA